MKTNEKSKVDRLYDASAYTVVKVINTLILPLFGSLYFIAFQLWGMHYTEYVLGAILIAIFGLSGWMNYHEKGSMYDGEMNVIETEGKKVYDLSLNADPEALENKRAITFRVNK